MLFAGTGIGDGKCWAVFDMYDYKLQARQAAAVVLFLFRKSYSLEPNRTCPSKSKGSCVCVGGVVLLPEEAPSLSCKHVSGNSAPPGAHSPPRLVLENRALRAESCFGEYTHVSDTCIYMCEDLPQVRLTDTHIHMDM